MPSSSRRMAFARRAMRCSSSPSLVIATRSARSAALRKLRLGFTRRMESIPLIRSNDFRKNEESRYISVGPERQHQPQGPEFALAALETNEPPVRVNVERLRSQALKKGRNMGAGEGLVVDGAVERAHPGGVPVIVDDLRIRAAREQGFDQRDVAGARCEHQRGGAAIGLVVDAVQVAILQHDL